MASTPRQTAAEETAVERRRRRPGTLDRMAMRKLSVPEEIREANKDYNLRWSNDSENRIYARTQQDDWEKVSGIDPMPVDTDKFGKPIYAHLLRKPLAFWEEDQKAKMAVIRERERGMMRDTKTDPQDTRAEDKSYAVPGNSITTAYRP